MRHRAATSIESRLIVAYRDELDDKSLKSASSSKRTTQSPVSSNPRTIKQRSDIH